MYNPKNISPIEYPVEAITGRDIRDSVVFYRIKWAQYEGAETWEPIWNCEFSLESIVDFENSRFSEIGAVATDPRIVWVFSNDAFFLNSEGKIERLAREVALTVYPNYLHEFYEEKKRITAQ